MAIPNQTSNSGNDKPPERAGSGRREAARGEVSHQIDDWIAIEKDGTITAFSGKVELGTGVRTALAQIVAEELDLAPDQIHMVMGDTARTPDEGYTAGSMTISSSGSALRYAAAEARRALLEMAATHLGVAVDKLIVHDGEIAASVDPKRSISYADLMGGKAFNLPVTKNAPLKSFKEYRIVGKPIPREDLPAKAAGQKRFVHDLKIPGMLHARLVRPPNPTAQFVALDESSIQNIPGIEKVFQSGNFVGIIAEREEQAIKAAKQLKVEWQDAVAYPAGMDDLFASLRDQPADENLLLEKGDLQKTLAGSAKQIHATYYYPFHAHASIGPSCAVADVNGSQVTVWSSTPGPYPLRGALSQLLNIPLENIHMVFMEGAGKTTSLPGVSNY